MSLHVFHERRIGSTYQSERIGSFMPSFSNAVLAIEGPEGREMAAKAILSIATGVAFIGCDVRQSRIIFATRTFERSLWPDLFETGEELGLTRYEINQNIELVDGPIDNRLAIDNDYSTILSEWAEEEPTDIKSEVIIFDMTAFPEAHGEFDLSNGAVEHRMQRLRDLSELTGKDFISLWRFKPGTTLSGDFRVHMKGGSFG